MAAFRAVARAKRNDAEEAPRELSVSRPHEDYRKSAHRLLIHLTQFRPARTDLTNMTANDVFDPEAVEMCEESVGQEQQASQPLSAFYCLLLRLATRSCAQACSSACARESPASSGELAGRRRAASNCSAADCALSCVAGSARFVSTDTVILPVSCTNPRRRSSGPCDPFADPHLAVAHPADHGAMPRHMPIRHRTAARRRTVPGIRAQSSRASPRCKSGLDGAHFSFPGDAELNARVGFVFRHDSRQ